MKKGKERKGEEVEKRVKIEGVEEQEKMEDL